MTKIIKKNPKKWNKKLGFWEWKCGCIRFQDGYVLCDKHNKKGYKSLEKSL